MYIIKIYYLLFAVIEIRAKSYNLPKPIDLSHSLDEDTPNWDKNFKFRLIDQDKQELSNGMFYIKNNFIAAEHGSTHLDAPFHFNKNGWKTADIPIDNLISSGIVIDVSNKVKNNGDFELLPEHLEEWEKIHREIPQNTVILVNFGWSSKYNNRTMYYGNAEPPYQFPGISAAAAEWIINTKKVLGVGVDTPSTDCGKSTTYPTHRILSANNIFGLENVDLENKNLPSRDFDLIILPVKIKNGSGGPCRIVAV